MAYQITFASTKNTPSYNWPLDVGEIAAVPSFQEIRSDLEELLTLQSRPQIEGIQRPTYTFTLTDADCLVSSDVSLQANTTSSANATVAASVQTRSITANPAVAAASAAVASASNSTSSDIEISCDRACTDPIFLFTPTNLRICALLAAASLLLNSNLPVPFELSEDPASFRVLEDWGASDLLTNSAGKSVLRSINTCLISSCEAAPGVGSCVNVGLDELNDVSITVGNMVNVVSILDYYCDNLNNLFNTDLAGPGVVLSYILQTCLALVFFLLFKVLTLWPGRLGKTLGYIRPSLDEKAQSIQTQLSSTRFRTVLQTTLIEFQEVQLYFIGSIQVATFVSFSPGNSGPSSANSTSFAGTVLGSALVNVLGVNGVFAVLLIQALLQRHGVRWWYLCCLTSVTYALALGVAALGDGLMPARDDLWDRFRQDAAVEDCGRNPSPMTYCSPPVRLAAALGTGARGRWVFAVFGSLAYLGLAVDQLAYAFRGRLKSKMAGDVEKPRRRTRLVRLAQRAWPWIQTIGWFVIEAILYILTLLYFSALVQASPEAGIQDHGKWSFGQLIAIMVWAPTIVKYIYFNIFGLDDSSDDEVKSDQDEEPSPTTLFSRMRTRAWTT